MTIVCDANKLPEEIKNKAHEYTEKRKPRFRTFGITRDDVEYAWLNGFAFCLEGTVKIEAETLENEVHTWKEASSVNSYKAFQLQEENKTISKHILELEKENAELRKTYRKQRNKRIDELQKANAELKRLLDCKNCCEFEENECASCAESGHFRCKGKTQLAKAKEIVKKFSEFVNNAIEYDPEHPQEHTDLWNKLCEEAKQF